MPGELDRRTKLLEKMDEAIAGLKKRSEQEQAKEQAKYEKKVAERERKARETGKKVSVKSPRTDQGRRTDCPGEQGHV